MQWPYLLASQHVNAIHKMLYIQSSYQSINPPVLHYPSVNITVITPDLTKLTECTRARTRTHTHTEMELA
jgi:hypothetical protein